MRRTRKTQEQTYAILVIPDCHTPAHDAAAINTICAYASTRRYDAIVQVGDFIDHESISRFAKENIKALANGDLLEEWAIAKRVMARILKAARTVNPDCKWYQLEGNHESRLQKFVSKYPMLRGLDLQKNFGLEEMGGTWVPADSEGAVLRFEQIPGKGIVPRIARPTERSHVYYHGASFLHGWRYNMHSAKSHTDLCPWPGLTVYGHVHTAQLHTRTVWGLDKPWAMTIGWLGLPWPEYTLGHPNQWVTAFGEVHLDRSCPGNIFGVPIRVVDGRLICSSGLVYSEAA